jgi:hypothetical protein
MLSGMCTFCGGGKAKAETESESEGEVEPDLLLCEHTLTNPENAKIRHHAFGFANTHPGD